MFAIKVENILKRFGNIIAVNDVSFNVKKGEIFGFLGPNGAGKTTTIRMLTGILIPDMGKIEIGGINLKGNQIKAKMKMGVVPEKGNVYVDLTAGQNLNLAGKFYGLPKKELKKKTEALLNALGLYERRNDLVRTFSKGMKQRIGIACAMVHEPEILFLDEPTEGLDVQSRRLIINKIIDINKKGGTVFLTTHNIDEANRLCERVCIINKGKIAAIDMPEKLKLTFDKTRSVEVSFESVVNENLFVSEFIIKIEKYGDKFRLYTNDPDKAVKHIVSIAKKNDLRIVSMNICGASLEEAFVRLTGG